MTAVAAPHSALAAEGPPDPELTRIRDLIYQVNGIFDPHNKLGPLLDRRTRRMSNAQGSFPGPRHLSA